MRLLLLRVKEAGLEGTSHRPYSPRGEPGRMMMMITFIRLLNHVQNLQFTIREKVFLFSWVHFFWFSLELQTIFSVFVNKRIMLLNRTLDSNPLC